VSRPRVTLSYWAINQRFQVISERGRILAAGQTVCVANTSKNAPVGGNEGMPKINSDERRSHRANVLLVAAIEAGNVRVPVRVSNLSAHGALVLSEAVFERETQVVFRCNGHVIESWVAWVRAPQTGIQFGEPIQPEIVLRKSLPSNQMISKDIRNVDFKRPGFRGKRLSDEERKVVEEWRATQ
jgi:hypothetical protein